MADEEKSGKYTPPVPYEISKDAYTRWEGLPNDGEFHLSISRIQLDALFLGLRQSTIATARLRDAFLFFTQGKNEECQKEIYASNDESIRSYSNFNIFIEYVMQNAHFTGDQDGE